jgi:hypothetical protein
MLLVQGFLQAGSLLDRFGLKCHVTCPGFLLAGSLMDRIGAKVSFYLTRVSFKLIH